MLGDDPKPLAPQLRFPHHIAHALQAVEMELPEVSEPGLRFSGGGFSSAYDRCFDLAGKAYDALRQSADLWTSLLRLTAAAGGAGCRKLRTREGRDAGDRAKAAVAMVRERLRTDVPDSEQAKQEFLTVMRESSEALYPFMMDKVHQMGLFWK